MQQPENHNNIESSPPLKDSDKTPSHSRHDSGELENQKETLLKEREQELELKNQELFKNLLFSIIIYFF